MHACAGHLDMIKFSILFCSRYLVYYVKMALEDVESFGAGKMRTDNCRCYRYFKMLRVLVLAKLELVIVKMLQ